MKVFKIDYDVNNFQSLCFVDNDFWSLEESYFECQRRLDDWKMPEIYCQSPHKKRGNFFFLFGVSGAFVLDTHAKVELADLLEQSGELLPLYMDDEPMYLFNALVCLDVLNEKKSDCTYFKSSGRVHEIKKYVFDRKRINGTPLFKFPEKRRTQILTYTGMGKRPEDTFKGRVEKCGLTGLIFEELWDDGVND
ncbi:MAG: hypothetical protein KDA65_12250 [Planctomycetaceae bacterium]|nr:hypothetical protein [Planctomycetaceae bacterium]